MYQYSNIVSQVTAILDFQRHISKSENKVETTGNGSIPAKSRKRVAAAFSYGRMMQLEERCDQS